MKLQSLKYYEGIGGSMLHSNHDEPIKLWLSITRQEVLGTEYLSAKFNSTDETLKGLFVSEIFESIFINSYSF